MSYTLAELRTGVGYWLHESGVVGGLAGGSASAETLYFINEAYKELLRLFPIANEPIGLKPANIDWASGTELYDLATDFQWMKRVEGNWHTGTAASDRFEIYPLKDKSQRFDFYTTNAAQGEQVYYYLDMTTSGQQIGFIPIPGVTLTAYIKYWYWPKTTKLVDEDDTILAFMEEHHGIIEIRTVMKILSKAGKPTDALFPELQVMMRDLKRNIAALEQQVPKTARFYNDGYFTE